MAGKCRANYFQCCLVTLAVVDDADEREHSTCAVVHSPTDTADSGSNF